MQKAAPAFLVFLAAVKSEQNLLDFVGVFCEKTRIFRKNIVDNEMKLRYYET